MIKLDDLIDATVYLKDTDLADESILVITGKDKVYPLISTAMPTVVAEYIKTAIELQQATQSKKKKCTCPHCHGAGLVGTDGSTCGCIIAGCRDEHTYNFSR